jgi:amino acid transporter
VQSAGASYNRRMGLPSIDLSNPDDVFGVSIFTFFFMAVVVFGYIAYRFMTQTGEKTKKGERVMVWAALAGSVLVLVYAALAFLFKIII